MRIIHFHDINCLIHTVNLSKYPFYEKKFGIFGCLSGNYSHIETKKVKEDAIKHYMTGCFSSPKMDSQYFDPVNSLGFDFECCGYRASVFHFS